MKQFVFDLAYFAALSGITYSLLRPTPVPTITEVTSHEDQLFDAKLFHCTGWPQPHLEHSELANKVQSGVISLPKPFGLFVSITLTEDFDDLQVRKAVSQVPLLLANHNKQPNAEQLVATIACSHQIWSLWDTTLSEDAFFPFPNRNIVLEKGVQPLSKSNKIDDLLLLVKGQSVDEVSAFARNVRMKFKRNIASFHQTVTFSNGTTKGFTPNLPKDLTGFIIGTENPDHSLAHLLDNAVIGNTDAKHVGGSFLFAGRFAHNLKKFDSLSNKERSRIIGRDYTREGVGVRHFDHRPENPRLSPDSSAAKSSSNNLDFAHAHVAKCRGFKMYRQPMSYVSENEEGTYYVAYSDSLQRIDTCIGRMTGDADSAVPPDNLYFFSEMVTGNYYYVPSISELSSLLGSNHI